MIDWLSNPAWINPQTDCLLFLQNIRLNHLENFDKLFLSITIFGEFWLPTLICAIIYWCIDFRTGIYLFSLEGINILLAHLFKMMACVYRPWVLNSNIKPSQCAFALAKGYSFPSGHSAMSASVFGGLAYLLRKNKLFCIFLVTLIFLVGFSRMWLGVHTPQDVICGFLTGLILIFAVDKLINWAEINKNRYVALLLITDILAFIALLYMLFFNTYRIDYIDGEMLVNPQKSIYNTVILYGYGLGILNGCFLCRIFCPFDPKSAALKTRILRGIIGAICITAFIKPIIAFVFANTLSYKAAMTTMFLAAMFVTLIYPMIFTKFKFKTKN